MQDFADPRVSAGSWAAAWRGWRDNPIAESYARSRQQREEALPWYRRSPGLLVLGALLALGVTAGNGWLLADSLQYAGPGARPFIAANASLGIGITLAAALLFCLCWLAAASYRAYSFSLGFLERSPRRRFRMSLDDMLAVTSLTEQELLVGALRFGLAQLAWPLGLAALCAALFAVRMLPGAVAESGLALVLVWFLLFSGGLLANAALLLIGLAVSICEQAGLWPGIGAAGLVLMQPLIAGGMVLAAQGRGFAAGAQGTDLVIRFASGGILLLLAGLLLYLARRLEWLRRGLSGGFFLLLLAPYAVLAGGLVISAEFDSPESLLVTMLDPLRLLVSLDPLLLSVFFEGDSSITMAETLAAPFGQWLLYLPLRLLLAAAAAEFARDAIRRRKWSTAQ